MNFNLLNSVHFWSDVSIAFAYLGLSIFCWSLAGMRRGWERGTCFLFGLFILLCGLTHANEAYFEVRGVCGVTSSWAANVKAITGVISLITLVLAWSRYVVVSLALQKSSSVHDPCEMQAQHDCIKETNDKIDEISEKTEFLLRAKA